MWVHSIWVPQRQTSKPTRNEKHTALLPRSPYRKGGCIYNWLSYNSSALRFSGSIPVCLNLRNHSKLISQVWYLMYSFILKVGIEQIPPVGEERQAPQAQFSGREVIYKTCALWKTMNLINHKFPPSLQPGWASNSPRQKKQGCCGTRQRVLTSIMKEKHLMMQLGDNTLILSSGNVKRI